MAWSVRDGGFNRTSEWGSQLHVPIHIFTRIEIPSCWSGDEMPLTVDLSVSADFTSSFMVPRLVLVVCLVHSGSTHVREQIELEADEGEESEEMKDLAWFLYDAAMYSSGFQV